MKRFLKVAAIASLALVAACGGPVSRVGKGTYVGGAVPELGDTKPHVWTSGHPYNHAVHGVDVSRYQGDVDWAQARRGGVSFAFLKATEGGDHADPEFRRYWARDAGRGHPARRVSFLLLLPRRSRAGRVVHRQRPARARRAAAGSGRGMEPPFPQLPRAARPR